MYNSNNQEEEEEEGGGGSSNTPHHHHQLTRVRTAGAAASSDVGQSLLEDYAKLYHRLARTSLGLEPHGYRSRWTEDFILSFDVRDAHKVGE